MSTFLITSGPTQEPIDPVRYLSNHSSGKMGTALANAAIKKGHKVIFITGPSITPPPANAKVIRVTSAKQMFLAVKKNYKKADVIIKAAAVADYRPAMCKKTKIKKNADTLTLKLVKNPDILSWLGKNKKKNQILVGFAAETNNVMNYAKKKLKEKNCDWIVLNNVSKKDIGFGSDNNKVTLITLNKIISIPKTSKNKLAKQIIKTLKPLCSSHTKF